MINDIVSQEQGTVAKTLVAKLTSIPGSVIKTIDIKLDKIGYTVYRHILDSSFLATRQSRERVYLKVTILI